MENSLNSSSPESSASNIKSIFKKPTNLYQAFEVSLEESITAVQNNKSELALDTSSSESKKVLPFKKTRKSIQHSFSITSDDSLVNSESEESMTFKKPPPSVFSKKSKPLTEFFNVSFNETNASKTLSKSLDDSITIYNKSNPFKKKNTSQHEILVGDEASVCESQTENVCLEESHKQSLFDGDGDDDDESSVLLTKQNPFRVSEKQNRGSIPQSSVLEKSVENEATEPDTQLGDVDESSTVFTKQNPFRVSEKCSSDVLDMDKSVELSANNSNVSLKKSQKRFLSETDLNEADSTTHNTKQNPFRKSKKRDSLTDLQLSVTNENNSVGNRAAEMQSNISRENDDADLSIMQTKLNPFKKSLQGCNSMLSVTEEGSKENSLPTSAVERSQNISVERSVARSINNTISYLEQSSINDENLNDWMSDQSHEEVPPQRISFGNGNLSQTKEKPIISSPTNTLSVWEQKLNEIVSNADSKRQALKSKSRLDTPKKPIKKSHQIAEKPVNKYRPKLIKPAPFATKNLYNFIIKKLNPKYGIDTMVEAENLVSSICDTVKKVNRKKTHQKKLIQDLKKEMAEAGIIETTVDFYEFVIKFLPYSFRVKVVPCVQPVTNIVYPPKDTMNPFDKIL